MSSRENIEDEVTRRLVEMMMQAAEGEEEEDYYSDDECYSESEDGFVELDPEVSAELDRRRKADPPIMTPASPEILRKVRSYFEVEGGQPMFYGGYLDIMERLGAINSVSSKDPLVKDMKYNKWRMTFRGNETNDEEENKAWNKLKQDHLARVRLLRYKEFIELQETVGLGISPDWSFGTACSEHPLDAFNKEDDRDKLKDDESKLETEWELTLEEIEALGTMWVTNGFYSYVNHEKIYVGLAVGQEGIRNYGRGDYRMHQFDVCQETLFAQVDELLDRYNTLGCPLGPKAQFDGRNKNNRKKNKKKKGGLGTHAQEIQERVKSLFQTIHRVLSPSGAIAQYVAAIARMLQAACQADPDVARALTTDTSVLELRKKALKCAKDADADMESRPVTAGSVWWNAYDELTVLVFHSIYALGKEASDSTKAKAYFCDHVEDAIFTSIQSPHAAERFSALKELPKIIFHLPSNVFSRILKDSKKWQLIQDACAIDAFDQEDLKRNYREQKRQDVYSLYAAEEAIGFFSMSGQFGSKIDDSAMLTTNVKPGKGSTKVIHKGIVPILLEIADSDCIPLAVKAMDGLGQLSRVKDCRVLFWQHPKGIDLIHKCLKSSNMNLVSETMLFVVHLLWDTEHADKLTNLSDPPLEEVAIRWAAFSMQRIIEKCEEMRKEGKIEEDKLHKEFLEDHMGNARNNDIIKQQQLDLKAEERRKKKNRKDWLEYETDEYRANPLSSALCRSILVLSTMHGIDPARILKVNALHLVNCCIDVPTVDHHQGSATLLSNILAWRGSEDIVPNMFPDAEHLLQSLIDRVELLAQQGTMDGKAAVFMMLAGRLKGANAWKACFKKVEEIDESYRFWINGPIMKMSAMRPEQATRDPERSRQYLEASRNTVNPACGSLTGKLKACGGCGKLESKAKEYKCCARCQSVVYCGRECQVSAWKSHKKECKVLAAVLGRTAS